MTYTYTRPPGCGWTWDPPEGEQRCGRVLLGLIRQLPCREEPYYLCAGHQPFLMTKTACPADDGRENFRCILTEPGSQEDAAAGSVLIQAFLSGSQMAAMPQPLFTQAYVFACSHLPAYMAQQILCCTAETPGIRLISSDLTAPPHWTAQLPVFHEEEDALADALRMQNGGYDPPLMPAFFAYRCGAALQAEWIQSFYGFYAENPQLSVQEVLQFYADIPKKMLDVEKAVEILLHYPAQDAAVPIYRLLASHRQHSPAALPSLHRLPQLIRILLDEAIPMPVSLAEALPQELLAIYRMSLTAPIELLEQIFSADDAGRSMLAAVITAQGGTAVNQGLIPAVLCAYGILTKREMIRQYTSRTTASAALHRVQNWITSGSLLA